MTPLSIARLASAALLLAGLLASPAAAQDLSPGDRAIALTRVRSVAACVERHNAELQRVLRLISESERQRDGATDARVRTDAERALDSLIARAAGIQREARACVGGVDLPSPGTVVITQAPPPDDAADAVARTGGTVREVERDTQLSARIRVERAEQVDGQGRLDPAVMRASMRAIAPRLDACYQRHLENGSAAPAALSLVFTVRGTGARAVTIERSGFSDPTFDRCVRAATQRLRSRTAPQGGDATYSYRLRFGG